MAGELSSLKNLEHLLTGAAKPATPAEVRRAVSTGNNGLFQQVEALMNLYHVLPPDQLMPPTRGWAASPDLLLLLVDLVRSRGPRQIVECGSGVSTLWISKALRHYGIDGRIIALDHEAMYAEQTRHSIASHGLEKYASVVHAPLEELVVNGTQYLWYASNGWQDLANCDMLLVDGPPAATGPHARYPALPLLLPKLSETAIVILDDMIRVDEQEVLKMWQDEFPDFAVTESAAEKGVAMLSRIAGSRSESAQPAET